MTIAHICNAYEKKNKTGSVGKIKWQITSVFRCIWIKKVKDRLYSQQYDPPPPPPLMKLNPSQILYSTNFLFQRLFTSEISATTTPSNSNATFPPLILHPSPFPPSQFFLVPITTAPLHSLRLPALVPPSYFPLLLSLFPNFLTSPPSPPLSLLPLNKWCSGGDGINRFFSRLTDLKIFDGFFFLFFAN